MAAFLHPSRFGARFSHLPFNRNVHCWRDQITWKGSIAMERRAFVALVGAVLAAGPTSARAQQGSRLRTVGVLMGIANDEEAQGRADVIERGLAKRGWIVGQNLHMEYRFAAGDPEQMATFSKELAALHPDVIIGHSTPVVAALLQA